MTKSEFIRRYIDAPIADRTILVDESLVDSIAPLSSNALLRVLRESDLLKADFHITSSEKDVKLQEGADLALIDAVESRSHRFLEQKLAFAFHSLRVGGILRVVTHTRKGANTHVKIVQRIFGNAE